MFPKFLSNFLKNFAEISSKSYLYIFKKFLGIILDFLNFVSIFFKNFSKISRFFKNFSVIFEIFYFLPIFLLIYNFLFLDAFLRYLLWLPKNVSLRQLLKPSFCLVWISSVVWSNQIPQRLKNKKYVSSKAYLLFTRTILTMFSFLF